jgi:hypothetical protein
MPPEKSTPTTSSLGSSVALLPSDTLGSSTRTIERLCVTPVMVSCR